MVLFEKSMATLVLAHILRFVCGRNLWHRSFSLWAHIDYRYLMFERIASLLRRCAMLNNAIDFQRTLYSFHLLHSKDHKTILCANTTIDHEDIEDMAYFGENVHNFALQWCHNERVSIVYSTVCSGTDQCKHQSSASLAFPHKGPVTREIFPLDDVIMDASFIVVVVVIFLTYEYRLYIVEFINVDHLTSMCYHCYLLVHKPS